MAQELKPKKAIRKKSKPSAMTRPLKRNKKKKRQLQQHLCNQGDQEEQKDHHHRVSDARTLERQQKQQNTVQLHHMIQRQQSSILQKQHPQQQLSPKALSPSKLTKLSQSTDNLSWNHDLITKSNREIVKTPSITPSINYFLSENATMYPYSSSVSNLTKPQQQEMFTMCENSSAYESSEDTGVGGLSESELIGASDGIGK